MTAATHGVMQFHQHCETGPINPVLLANGGSFFCYEAQDLSR